MLQDREDMRSMFRVCATERLFVPDIFPDMDRAIYIDTDLIFMRLAEQIVALENHADATAQSLTLPSSGST